MGGVFDGCTAIFCNGSKKFAGQQTAFCADDVGFGDWCGGGDRNFDCSAGDGEQH